MGRQSVRQRARAEAKKVQAERLAERRQREERLSALGIQVMTDLGEGRALLERRERDAAKGVRSLMEEGLSLGETLTWLGPEITQAEVRRLLRLLEEEDGSETSGASSSGGQEDGGETSGASSSGGQRDAVSSTGV